MNNKIFDDGMLVVEKVEVKKAEAPKVATFSLKKDAIKKISCEQIADTAFSYGTVPLNILRNDGTLNHCAICGEETSYSNRYVCPSCWQKNKEKLCEALKSKLKGKTIEI